MKGIIKVIGYFALVCIVVVGLVFAMGIAKMLRKSTGEFIRGGKAEVISGVKDKHYDAR